MRHGYGTYFYKNGAKESLVWENGVENGEAKYCSANGRTYIKVYK